MHLTEEPFFSYLYLYFGCKITDLSPYRYIHKISQAVHIFPLSFSIGAKIYGFRYKLSVSFIQILWIYLLLQKPFPDRHHLYRMAICLYLCLVVAGNDVALVAGKGFQKFDESSHFSLIGCLVIQIIRHLDGQPGRWNEEIF